LKKQKGKSRGQLTQLLLEWGPAAATFHGRGTFLGEPPELALVKKNWKGTKTLLPSINLATCEGS
jgi:hypothetical protein